MEADMKPFFSIFLTTILAASIVAQSTTAKSSESRIYTTNPKWAKGARLNNTSPTLSASSTNTNSNGQITGARGDLTLSVKGYYYQAEFVNQSGKKVKGIYWE